MSFSVTLRALDLHEYTFITRDCTVREAVRILCSSFRGDTFDEVIGLIFYSRESLVGLLLRHALDHGVNLREYYWFQAVPDALIRDLRGNLYPEAFDEVVRYCRISDTEYQKVLEEIPKYRTADDQALRWLADEYIPTNPRSAVGIGLQISTFSERKNCLFGIIECVLNRDEEMGKELLRTLKIRDPEVYSFVEKTLAHNRPYEA